MMVSNTLLQTADSSNAAAISIAIAERSAGYCNRRNIHCHSDSNEVYSRVSLASSRSKIVERTSRALHPAEPRIFAAQQYFVVSKRVRQVFK